MKKSFNDKKDEQLRNWRSYAELLEMHVTWYERWTFGWMLIAFAAIFTAMWVLMTAQ